MKEIFERNDVGMTGKLGMRDIDELHCLAEAVLSDLAHRKVVSDEKNYLDFYDNEELHEFTLESAKNISLKEIKEKYLSEFLPMARTICRTDPDRKYGMIISEDVDDEYLEDLLAFRWKENLKKHAKRWDKIRKRERQLTTLTFNFNEEAVAKAGLTTDELLEDMRSYAKECEVDEISYGVFTKEGKDSMAILLGYAVRKEDSDPDFVNYLDSWIADIAGTVEDCKVEIEKRRKEKKKEKKRRSSGI